MRSLDEIGLDSLTDKSSANHNYCVKYEKYLQFDRLKELKILEIGVAGGHSLRMWKEFYPNATVVGIDITPVCSQYQNV